MKTRIIHTKIWEDDYFSDLKPLEKLVFLYYLTNDRINIIHCYEIKDERIALDTGVSIDIIKKCKEKFSIDGKFRYYKNYVVLVNSDKYESYRGEKNDLAKETLLKEMSSNALDWYYNKTDRGMHRGIHTQQIPPINHNTEIINNKLKVKGVVRGEITEEDLQEISDKYKVPLHLVKLAREEMDNWLSAKGKHYKDYKAGLRNWVLRDAKKIMEKSVNPQRQNIDARNL